MDTQVLLSHIICILFGFMLGVMLISILAEMDKNKKAASEVLVRYKFVRKGTANGKSRFKLILGGKDKEGDK